MNVANDYDYVAIVLDSLGKPLDTLRYHEEGDEVIKSVVMDDNLNFYVTGTGNGNTLTQKYSLNETVGINEIAEKENKFEIIPNPFSNELIIESREPTSLAEFRLFNSAGILIHEQIFDNVPVKVFKVEILPNGIYFYQIKTGEIFKSGKLIKQ